jgi:Uncharacterized protein conserved in bacteria
MAILDKIRASLGLDEDFDEQFEEVPTHSNSADFDEAPKVKAGKNKVVNIHATTQLKVVLVKPESYSDSTSIADHLNAKRTIVLNLESANRETARRIIDFLGGVAYANNGQMQKVANATYIITPYSVEIMGDLLDELENNGYSF